MFGTYIFGTYQMFGKNIIHERWTEHKCTDFQRRNNDFHFSQKGGNGVLNAICYPGVNSRRGIMTYDGFRGEESDEES